MRTEATGRRGTLGMGPCGALQEWVRCWWKPDSRFVGRPVPGSARLRLAREHGAPAARCPISSPSLVTDLSTYRNERRDPMDVTSTRAGGRRYGVLVERPGYPSAEMGSG